MYSCYLHNWYSHTMQCPSCVTYLTSTTNTTIPVNLSCPDCAEKDKAYEQALREIDSYKKLYTVAYELNNKLGNALQKSTDLLKGVGPDCDQIKENEELLK